GLIRQNLGIERDFKTARPLKLNPWFVNYESNGLGKRLSRKLILFPGVIPKPYRSQVKQFTTESIGANPARRSMRNASHTSSNDGSETKIYGRPLTDEMKNGSFVETLILSWTGHLPRDFEAKVVEKCLIGALTNGPGTISAQGAKLSTSAGNTPNTAMIATLACIGDVHGGNGRRAVEYLCRIFKNVNIDDPWNPNHGADLQDLVKNEAEQFSKVRLEAKEADVDYERIPCLGHPVFRDKPVNYDPRERVVAEYLESKGLCNIFLQFYHMLAFRLKEIGIARNVWAVNLDGAIASVVLAVCWKELKDKHITLRRVCDIAFMLFALGRVAGAGGEFLDHQDYGTPMDMRIPVNEFTSLRR
ncbi:MAG TPA: citrate/2-methylcitrate synthase, partial [Sedimentisphaerales bacterium]|nr:citrate/2-methylcitrate synthase [Sedimentisphaerales bacterium]